MLIKIIIWLGTLSIIIAIQQQRFCGLSNSGKVTWVIILSQRLIYISIAAGISGIICTPIVSALLVVVVCGFRAYKTTFQRLILYHIIIALFCECSFALWVKIDFPHPRWFCIIAIYLYLYCTLSWYVYTTTVTNYLFLLTLKLLRGNTNIS
jgi:hypothetical protein